MLYRTIFDWWTVQRQIPRQASDLSEVDLERHQHSHHRLCRSIGLSSPRLLIPMAPTDGTCIPQVRFALNDQKERRQEG